MSDYDSVIKIDWFIEKLLSAGHSRQGIIGRAAQEFPDIPLKTLEGTIGQYWTDSVNPKWPAFKAIIDRGLRVVEEGGIRRIVKG